MAAIFGLVKSKVTWNKYAGYFPENGVKKTYKEGKGNVFVGPKMNNQILKPFKVNKNKL